MTPEQLAAEIRRLELATRRLVRDLVAGEFSSAFRGRGVEFVDLREYEPGDDVRAIDWRATARLGTTQVRLFREERERTIVLVLDASASGAVGSRLRGKRQLGAEVAAVLSFAAVYGNDRIGAALAGRGVERWLPPRKGRQQAMRVLETVLTAPVPAGRGDLAAALADLEPEIPSSAGVIVLSDFLDPGTADPLGRMAQRHDVVAVHLVDALEAELPAAGLVEFSDPETGAQLVLDTDDPAVRAHVRARHAAHVRETQAQLQAAGVDVLALDASAPFEQPLVEFVRRRTGR